MTFTPVPFATPIATPSIMTATISLPYISPTDYRFAPTSVGTQSLVPGAASPQSASLQSLSQVLMRATQWVDEICFPTPEGSLAATLITDSTIVKIKPSGNVVLICNVRPIREVISVAVGPNSSQLSPLTQSAASAIVVAKSTITIPSFATGSGPAPYFGLWPSINGEVFVLWQYVAGFPHTSLAADAIAGATTLSVSATNLAGDSVTGVDAFTLPTQFRIMDGANTETVTATAINGLTLTLAQPTQFAHTVPSAPDFIAVTAIPANVEQATISLTNVLIKMRSTRAQTLPSAPGGTPGPAALAEAGATADYTTARRLLTRYIVPFVRS